MIENTFKYCVNYEHYGEYSCEERGCNDEGICRCYTINDINISSVNINRITKSIYDQIRLDDKQHNRHKKINDIIYNYDSDMVNKYCIHRILTKNKIWDSSNWKAEISSGYYGDEVGEVTIKKDIFDKVCKEIKDVIETEILEEKINYVLNLEYGYILDKIKDKKYQVISIDKSQLDFGQDNHFKNVLHKTLEYYSDSNYLDNSIRGIAYKIGDKWRVVDGYHRLTQTKLEKVRIIGIK